MKEIKVLCGIVEHDGLVLITQRSQNMSQPLLWEFPGGKLEKGEHEKACLIRELKEELSINTEPHRRLTPTRHTYAEISIELIPYTCAFLSGTIKLQEHAAYKWVHVRDLLDYCWCPADLPVVKEYMAYKNV